MTKVKFDNTEKQFFLVDISLAFLTQNTREKLNLAAKTIPIISSQGKKYIEDNICGGVFADGFMQKGRKAFVIYMINDEKLQNHPLENQTGKTYKEHLEYVIKNYEIGVSAHVKQQPGFILSCSHKM